MLIPLTSLPRGRVLQTLGLALACCVLFARPAGADTGEEPATPGILAPASHQVAWLNIEAPRPQLLTRFQLPDYVTDVAARPGGGTAAVAVVRSNGASEILALDLTSLQLSPLAPATDASESLSAPRWTPDGTRVFFQREDVSVVGTSYGGGSTVQFPSRIEAVQADGSARSIVVENGRQPTISPDGVSLGLVRRLADGPTLIVRSLLDGSERTLVEPGRVSDIVSPQFSPQGDRIAFMAPVSSLQSLDENVFFSQLLIAAPIRLMHGVPWDLWIVAADGGSPPTQLALLGADDGTVAWSPDGTRLFVYGGTGSFIVDSSTREVTSLTYVAGYGSTSWVAN